MTWIHAAHATEFVINRLSHGNRLEHLRDGLPNCLVQNLSAYASLDGITVLARDHKCEKTPADELRWLIEQSDGDDDWLVQKVLAWHEEKKGQETT